MNKSFNILFKNLANNKAEKAGVIEFIATTEGDYKHTKDECIKGGVL